MHIVVLKTVQLEANEMIKETRESIKMQQNNPCELKGNTEINFG